MSGFWKLIGKKRFRQRGLAMALAFTTAFSILPASAMEAPVVPKAAVASETAVNLSEEADDPDAVRPAEPAVSSNDAQESAAASEDTGSDEAKKSAEAVDEPSVSANLPDDIGKKITEEKENGIEDEEEVDDTPAEKIIDSDLKNFIRAASLDGENITVEGDTWKVIKSGVAYDMSLVFKENSLQFVEDATPMTYTLPEGVKALGGGLIDIIVTSGDKTFTVNDNPFTVSEDGKKLTLVLNTADEDLSELNKTHNAQFEIKFKASFNLKDGEQEMDFGQEVKKKLIVDNTHNASVKKTNWYNPDTGRILYAIRINSTGISKNIKISDQMGGDVFKINTGSFTCDDPSVNFTVTQKSGNGFEATIDEIVDKEIKITYTATMDLTKVGENGSVTAGLNTVNITADNDADESDNTSSTPDRKITVTSIMEKSGEVETDKNGIAVLDANGKAKVNWTIKVNDERVLPLTGVPITDVLSGPQTYSGDGITVSKYIRKNSKDSLVSQETIPWSSLTAKTDNQFTYTPQDTTPYLYVITYTTTTDASSSYQDYELGNKIKYRGQEKSGKVEVGIQESYKFTVEKTADSMDREKGEINWTIRINVPAGGLPSLVVKDTYPHMTLGGTKYVEGLKDGDSFVSVKGLLEGESYTLDTSKANYFTMTFYQDTARTTAGLKQNNKSRVIKIGVTTKISDEWVAYAKEHPTDDREEQRHKNAVDVTAGSETADAYDRVYIAEPSLEKTSDGAAKYVLDKNGKTIPYYKYSLLFTAVSQDEIVIKEKLPEGFTFYTEAVGEEDMSEVAPGIFGGSGYHSQTHKSGGSISFEGDDTIRIKVPKNGNGYYTYYRADYYIIPKDLNAAKALNQKAADNGGKITLTNEAEYNGVKDTADVEYEIKGGYFLWKSLLNYSKLSGYDHTAKYEIILNHLGIKLNNGNNLIFTDTFENLSLDYFTIKFTPESALVSYDVSGSKLTAVIRDEVPVTVTYSAKVNGNKEVNFKNTADLMGHTHTSDETKDFTVGNAGSGNASIPGIRILKHEAGDMNKRLEGVSFALYKATAHDPVTNIATAGKPVKDKSGKQVVVTTDENGMAEIRGEDDRDGWVLEEGVMYYLQEVAPLKGYAKDDTRYTFVISEDGVADYDRYIYYDNDILKIKNYKAIKNPLVVTKTLAGQLPKNLDLYEISFSILDGDGKTIETKSLGEISEKAALGVTGYAYDEAAQKYTWTLSDVPEGDVIVQENVGKIKEGYSLVKKYRLGESGEYQVYPNGGIGTSVSDKTPTVNLINEYSEEKGTIAITKTVAGSAGKTFEDVKAQLTFTVEAAGESSFTKMTIQGTDAGWKETPAGSGKWVYTIGDVPAGDYIVTETNADVDGLLRTTVVNQVKTTEKGVAKEGQKDAATVKVTDKATANVSVENSYASKAALTIHKHIDSSAKGVTWDKDLKEKLSFEIKGPDSYERTVKASENGWTANAAGDTYSFTLTDLTEGIYTVTEKNGDVAYFTSTTTADCADWNGSSGTVSVQDENASITITNTYVRQKGVLQLVKTIAIGGGIADIDEIDQAQYRKKIEFEVTDPEGNKKVYNLEDSVNPGFVKEGHTYTLTIDPAIAGEYHVKETAYDIDADAAVRNYAVDSVVYEVERNGEKKEIADGMSDGCDTAVDGEKTTAVKITNTYSYPAGRLTLKKKVNGIRIAELKELADADKQKEGIIFTIFKREDSGEWTEYRKVKASDPEWKKTGEQEWTFVLDYMPVGTYYVSENKDLADTTSEQFTYQASDFEVTPGQDSTVVYDPSSALKTENTKELSTADFTFGNGQNVKNEMTVVYTNTYRNTGELTITKKIVSNDPQLDWDKVKGQIVFEIENADGSFHKTIAGTDSDWKKQQENVYTYTVRPLAQGNYTVREIVDDTMLKEYTRSTAIDGTVDEDGETTAVISENTEPALKQNVTYTNEYTKKEEKKEAVLILKKTVEGDKNWEEVKSRISFEIKDASGRTIKTVKGTDADFIRENGAGETVVYEITGLEAGAVYTVSEIVEREFDDADRVTTVKINALQAEEKMQAQLLLAEDKTLNEISFTNRYTDKTGELELVKKLAGYVTAQEAENALRFEIKDAQGNDIDASKTEYSLKDFTKNADGTYTLKKKLPIGVYQVKETVCDVTGYAIKSITYQLTAFENAQPQTVENAEKNGASVTITENETGRLLITDEYTKEKSELVITKLIKGKVTQEEAKAALKFRVTDKDTGRAVDYTLDAFSYNALTQVYTLKLTDLAPGSYTVEETTYQIPGYPDATVTYSVDNAAASQGTSAQVVLKAAQSAKISFVDEYGKKNGTLRITKKLKGSVSEPAAEKALRFKVTDQSTGNSKTYSLNDFDYDADKEIYVLELEKTPGGYTVEESVTDISGYRTVKVTYQVGNGSVKSGTETDVKVASGEVTKVAFTDQYEKKEEAGGKDDKNKENTTNKPSVTSGNAVKTSETAKQTTKETTNSGRLPKTGDDTPLGLYLILILIGAAGMAASIFRKKEKIEE